MMMVPVASVATHRFCGAFACCLPGTAAEASVAGTAKVTGNGGFGSLRTKSSGASIISSAGGMRRSSSGATGGGGRGSESRIASGSSSSKLRLRNAANKRVNAAARTSPPAGSTAVSARSGLLSGAKQGYSTQGETAYEDISDGRGRGGEGSGASMGKGEWDPV